MPMLMASQWVVPLFVAATGKYDFRESIINYKLLIRGLFISSVDSQVFCYA